MKRIISFISVFALLLTSCTGEQGPPGFDGFNGQDGLNGETAIAFEIDGNFNAANGFQIQRFYDFEVFQNEVTLVYRLWDITENDLDIWRLLPQTVIFNDGSDLVYNFDFTQEDVIVFLESTSDLGSLGPQWTENQIFRVIVVPADVLGNVDVSNLDAVLDATNIENFEIR